MLSFVLPRKKTLMTTMQELFLPDCLYFLISFQEYLYNIFLIGSYVELYPSYIKWKKKHCTGSPTMGDILYSLGSGLSWIFDQIKKT